MADAPTVCAATRLGLVRAANEDRWCVGNLGGDGTDADWIGQLPDHQPWALVADGMGGHGAGEVASSTALREFRRLLDRDGPVNLRSIFAEANRAVFDAMDEPWGRKAMGTTIAGLCRQDRGLSVFNVGDSRIYLLRRGRLKLLSVDDTIPRRGGGRSHALTQSLGGTSMPVPLAPHFAALKPLDEDVLLLCTDGLTDMLDEETLCVMLTDKTPNVAARLADAAVDAGGRDNVTVIVLAY